MRLGCAQSKSRSFRCENSRPFERAHQQHCWCHDWRPRQKLNTHRSLYERTICSGKPLAVLRNLNIARQHIDNVRRAAFSLRRSRWNTVWNSVFPCSVVSFLGLLVNVFYLLVDNLDMSWLYLWMFKLYIVNCLKTKFRATYIRHRCFFACLFKIWDLPPVVCLLVGKIFNAIRVTPLLDRNECM